MPLRLYNTLSREIEEFSAQGGSAQGGKPPSVNLYTCGPTVYNYAHIGNLRTYIFEDILQRTLKWNGYKVKRVMNITDVGHLTSDADTGEDKIEKQAVAQKTSPQKIAKFYTSAFLKDLGKLNAEIPEIIAPATAHIREQQALIKKLFQKGFAYDTDQAVYFDVAKFKSYGKLSGQSLKEKIVAARSEVIQDPGKKNNADFALWLKLVGHYKNHLLHWPSPWGEGFPGWHLECSAISRAFLGQPFDIHTGGVDHIGTHHENEIAQSEAAYGKPLAKIWMHGEFLVIDSKRMGKSERNFITLADLEKKGFDPLAYRYLILGAHYRSPLNFSWESLKAAQKGLKNLREKIRDIKKNESNKGGKRGWDLNFSKAIDNDLNTPLTLSVLHAMLGDKSVTPATKISLVKDFDRILGLNLLRPISKSKIPSKIKELVAEREKCRRNEQFIDADRLRKEMDALGFIVEDTAEGPAIKPKK